MQVSTMREVDSRKIADFINEARDKIGQADEAPQVAYMLLPDYKPTFSYRYYNIRSRHFRVQETFFVAEDCESSAIRGVVTFADVDRGRAYLRLVAVGPELLEGTNGFDISWCVREAIGQLSQFVQLQAVRLVMAKQGPAGELVGPHVSPAFAKILDECGFKQLTRLEKEGGRDIHLEIYECPAASTD